MTYRRLQGLSFVSLVAVAAAAAVHGAQDLSLGGGEAWQIAGAFPAERTRTARAAGQARHT